MFDIDFENEKPRQQAGKVAEMGAFRNAEARVMYVTHTFARSGGPQLGFLLRFDDGAAGWHNLNWMRPSTAKMTAACALAFGVTAAEAAETAVDFTNTGWDPRTGLRAGEAVEARQQEVNAALSAWAERVFLGKSVRVSADGNGMVYLNPSRRPRAEATTAPAAAPGAAPGAPFNDDDIPF